MTDLKVIEIWRWNDSYQGFMRLKDRANLICNMFLEQSGDICAIVSEPHHIGQLPFYFPSSYLVSDFHKNSSLKLLRNNYHLSRIRLWQLLKELNLDPWKRVIDDYRLLKSIAPVAKKHGMKPTTLSAELKKRGIPIPTGRVPIRRTDDEIHDAKIGNPSFSEFCRRLEVSWKSGKKLEARVSSNKNT